MSGVSFLPLGGLGYIGLNGLLIEVGEYAYLVDCGIEFPEENEPGVDTVLPDLEFIRRLEGKLRGIILTHGHEDHIGGVSHVFRSMKVPVYGPRLAIALLEERLEEYGIGGKGELRVVEKGTTLSLEGISVEFIRVTHSIPDCFALAIRTPEGTVVHTGDWKWDEEPVDGEFLQWERLEELGREGVTLLFGDSTNAEVEGRTRSEREVGRALERQIEEHEGRVIVAMFSSNLHRLHLLADIAQRTGRHLVLQGRGLRRFDRVSRRVGLNRIDPGVFASEDHMQALPPSRTLVCCTGTQGEPLSALYRASKGTHPRLQIQEGDLVLHSARKIPGNEGRVYDMFAGLTRLGAKVVHHRNAGIHASGHATRAELRKLLETLQPTIFVPVHGELSFLSSHAELASQAGVGSVRVFENGERFTLENGNLRKEGAESLQRLYFDGKNIGASATLGVRERWKMAFSGVVALQVEREGLRASVYAQFAGIPQTSERLVTALQDWVRQELALLPSYTPPAEYEAAAKMICRRFIFQHTGKKPTVLLRVSGGGQ